MNIITKTLQKLKSKATGKDTVVRLCGVSNCANNRIGLGEMGCNCKEIEICHGKCVQFVERMSQSEYHRKFNWGDGDVKND